MNHLFDVAEQLEISPQDLKQICKMLGIGISNDTLTHQDSDRLLQMYDAAEREGITLMEVAEHIVNTRTAQQATSSQRFSRREYIKQRFGVDPATAAPDSVIGAMDQHAQIGEQFGETGYAVVLDVMALTLQDRLRFGSSESQIDNRAIAGASDAIQNTYQNLEAASFFGNLNWGNGTTPALNGARPALTE